MPWEGQSQGFTLLMEALILQMSQSMPVNRIAKLFGISDNAIWRMLEKYIKEMIAVADYSDVEVIGIDETSQAKRHEYVTLFVDLIKRKLLFITDGRDSDTVEEFNSILVKQKGNPKNIREVSCDMSKSFIKGVKKYLPGAEITFDRFHCMKLLNEAVDQVRRIEVKNDRSLKGLRYVFLKNESELSLKHKRMLEELRISDCGKQTLEAHRLKELFRIAYQAKSEEIFEQYLEKWYLEVVHSGLEPMVKVGKTIKKHWDGIVRWKKSQINNGILEEFNSLIQAAKARARGYSSSKNFKIIAFLLTGKLNFTQLNPAYSPT